MTYRVFTGKLNQTMGKSVPKTSRNHGKWPLLAYNTLQFSLILPINKVSHGHQILSHLHQNLSPKTKNNYSSTTPDP